MAYAIRVDIHLGHFYEMVDEGAATIDGVAQKVMEAVEKAVNEATEWHAAMEPTMVNKLEYDPDRPDRFEPHTLNELLLDALDETPFVPGNIEEARRINLYYDFS